MRRRDYAGVAVVLLAAGLAVGWAGAVLLTRLGVPMTEAGLQLLAAIGGAMVTAVAVYLGAHWSGPDNHE